MSGAFSVTVEGAVLSGEVSGEGLPLVLIHGIAGDRHDWDQFAAALPPELARLRYDLRGFGRSTVLDGAEYSHSDDLLALMDARGIDRAPLIGLSMGGGIALNFALSHPERVSQLVLLSPAMIGWEWSDGWKGLWRGVVEAARSGNLALARQLWRDHPMFAVLRESPELADEMHRSVEAYHGRQWIRDNQRDELPDIDRLHTLAMPCLLLTGERDVADLRLIADVLEAAVPDIRRVDYAGAGHMIHLERASAVASDLYAFLS